MVPKFRAWDKPNKTMRTNDEIVIWSGQVYINEKKELGTKIRGFSCLPEHLMQSTGLRDKNGVEIFEGDVVSLTEGECSYSGIVVRDYYEFYIKGIGPRDCFDFQDVSNTFDGTTSLEVTTNIYKNPELLEQANEI